mgnify:CR=1 FL=1
MENTILMEKNYFSQKNVCIVLSDYAILEPELTENSNVTVVDPGKNVNRGENADEVDIYWGGP